VLLAPAPAIKEWRLLVLALTDPAVTQASTPPKPTDKQMELALAGRTGLDSKRRDATVEPRSEGSEKGARPNGRAARSEPASGSSGAATTSGRTTREQLARGYYLETVLRGEEPATRDIAAHAGVTEGRVRAWRTQWKREMAGSG
jgi:hypothetical protein